MLPPTRPASSRPATQPCPPVQAQRPPPVDRSVQASSQGSFTYPPEAPPADRHHPALSSGGTSSRPGSCTCGLGHRLRPRLEGPSAAPTTTALLRPAAKDALLPWSHLHPFLLGLLQKKGVLASQGPLQRVCRGSGGWLLRACRCGLKGSLPSLPPLKDITEAWTREGLTLRP